MPSPRPLAALLACSALTAAAAAQDLRAIPYGNLVPDAVVDWRSVAAGDLDGDGDLDLVFACFGTPPAGERNLQLRNDGDGWFTAGPLIGLAPSLSKAVVLGDFDGDGDLDAFFGNQGADAICRNDGSGGLALSAGDLPALTVETNAAVAADVDGDGDLDLVCACGGFDVLYRNTGNGVFVDASADLPSGWALSRDLDVGDYDGDGDLDLLVANQDADSQLYWNNGAGVFAVGPTLPPGSAVTGGDVDGDGDRDFVLSLYGFAFPIGAFHSNQLFRGDGAGGFVSSALPPAQPGDYSLHACRLVDLDGDGDLDLAVAGQGDGPWFNDGSGAFTVGTALPAATRHFADIDGDGDQDMIGVPTLRNDGGGEFVGAIEPPLLQQAQGEVVAVADVDGDGDADLLVRRNSLVQALANDGRGTFRNSLFLAATSSWVGEPWLVADWTGDGYPDLMQRQGNEYLANTDGTGLVQRPLPQAVWYPVTADIDGDGDLDLYARMVNSTVGTFVNDGAGNFSVIVTAALGLVGKVFDTGDLDGDGDPDLLFMNATGSIAWGRNVGTVPLSPVIGAFPVGMGSTASAAAADFDGDGDLDVVIGLDSPGGVRARLLQNDGAGNFVLAASLTAPQVSTALWVVVEDLDGDADPDLVLVPARYSGQQARCFRNDGGFVFVDATDGAGPWQGLDVPAGSLLMPADLDRDGDVDLVAATPDRTVFLTNLQHQLLAREQLQRGATWHLEVVQRPIGQSIAAVLVGTTELQPGVPTPFGELRIDPLSGATFGGVLVNEAGPVEVFSLAVPDQPALVGAVLFAQHVVFDANGLLLGNQLRSVVQ